MAAAAAASVMVVEMVVVVVCDSFSRSVSSGEGVKWSERYLRERECVCDCMLLLLIQAVFHLELSSRALRSYERHFSTARVAAGSLLIDKR